MDLVPCVHCKRHVGVTELACPFCAGTLPRQRAQLAFAGRLTRAAMFSAAVVACDAKKPAPAPTPAPVQQLGSAAAGSAGSADDLENMLDADGRTVDHPAPAPAVPVDAGVVVDAAVAVAVDAGISPERQQELIEQRREVDRRRKRDALERQRMLEQQNVRIQVNNKPYGAPPARRRVV